MKIEEAIAEIKESGLYGNQVHKETLELAIEALEKQVAKKPNIKELPDAFGRMYWNVCGFCNEEVESDYDYCPDCGQKIDWSEISET